MAKGSTLRRECIVLVLAAAITTPAWAEMGTSGPTEMSMAFQVLIILSAQQWQAALTPAGAAQVSSDLPAPLRHV